jgi:hypothetical protein
MHEDVNSKLIYNNEQRCLNQSWLAMFTSNLKISFNFQHFELSAYQLFIKDLFQPFL